MPIILTEVETFHPSITVPEGGDARTAASVDAPLQKLADRTTYLHEILKGESDLPDLIEREFLLELDAGFPEVLSDIPQWVMSAAGYWVKTHSDVGNGIVFLPIPKLRNGMQILRVDALLNAAHASAMTLTLQLYTGGDFDAPTAPTISTVEDETTPAATGLHSVGFDVVATVTSDSDRFRVAVTGSASASGDRVYAVRIRVADPGPRNF